MERAREKTRSVVDEILDRHILLSKLDDVTISRHTGVKLLEKNSIDPNEVIKEKEKKQEQKKFDILYLDVLCKYTFLFFLFWSLQVIALNNGFLSSF